MSANDDTPTPLPTQGVLYAVGMVLGCLRLGRYDDAEAVLLELGRELTVDSVNEAAVERQYVEVH